MATESRSFAGDAVISNSYGITRVRTLWLFAILVAGAALYYPGLRTEYFGDDYQWFFDPAPGSIFYYFTHSNPNASDTYRPLQAAFMILVQRYFGLETFAVHAANLLLHTALVCLLFIWLKKERFTSLQAFIASAFMLVSQANAMAVLSVDTLSQILSTLTGCVGLVLLQKHLTGMRPDRRTISGGGSGYYLLALSALVLALLSKESGVSFIAMALVLMTAAHARRSAGLKFVRGAVIDALPYLLALAIYFVIRTGLGVQGPGAGDGRYGFHLGLNLPRNLAMFLFQALVPASSVDAFTALSNRDLLVLAPIVAGWLMMVGLTGWGLVKSGRRVLAVALACLGLLGLFPMALMNKVSELYVYNSMPFFAALIGIGIGRILDQTNRTLKPILAFLLAGACFVHILAVREKALLMKQNGRQATQLLACIQSEVDRIPVRGELLLLTPRSAKPEYSVFAMSGFNVLDTGLHRIKEVTGRSDFKIRLIGEKQLAQEAERQDVLILSSDDAGQCYKYSR
jgi:hypothetical protein